MDNRRHFVLYAKGWYLKTNKIDDLKQILSHYSGIEPEYLNSNDVFSFLLNLTFSFPSIKEKAVDFIFGLHPSNTWKYFSNPVEYVFNDVVISNCLSRLMCTTKDECDKVLGGLGSPDENVLPLKPKMFFPLKPKRIRRKYD